MQNSDNLIDDRVSPSISEEFFNRKFTSALESENTREFVKKIMADEVKGINEKLDCAYSSKNYKDFQDAVSEIILDKITGDPIKPKLVDISKDTIKQYLSQENWEKFKFWAPLILSAVAILVAYIK